MKKLSSKIILSTIIVIIISILSISLLFYYKTKTVYEENANKNMLNETKINALLIEDKIRNVVELSAVLENIIVKNIDIEKVANDNVKMKEFEDSIKDEFVATIGLYKQKSGWIIFDSRVIKGANTVSYYYYNNKFQREIEYDAVLDGYSNDEWWSKAYKNGVVWTKPYFWENWNSHIISYSKLVKKDGVNIGVVGSEFFFDDLKDTISKLKIFDSGYYVLMDENFNMLYHPDAKVKSLYSMANGSLAFIADNIKKSNDKMGMIEYNYENKNKIMTYHKLSNGWVLAATSYENEIYADLNKMRNIAIVFSIFIIAFGIAASYIFGKLVTAKIVDLKNAALQLAECNTSIQIKIETNDEIGDLAKAFNKMSENINEVHTELLMQNESLEKTVYERTHQLEDINAGLEEEIQERIRIEEELENAKDAAEEASRSKSSFLARMSHEIRTPMNAIIGLAILALDSSPAPRIEDYLKKVKISADALLGIINDILDYSKIEANKLVLEKINFNIDDLFQEVTDITSIAAAEKNLELIVDCSLDIPSDLIGDPLRLKQILVNLVNNAIKFTNKGEVIINAKVLEKNNDTIKIIFSVKDSGIGISRKNIDHLFKSFSQADETTTRKYGGSGLGLVICKNLVEMMGGEIWVDSVLDKGSTFSFTSLFEIGKLELQNVNVEKVMDENLRILLVDDNIISLKVLNDMLTSFSFEVDTSNSGKEAVEKVLKSEIINKPYNVVILDWKMPEIDGLEASKRIKTIRGVKKLPQILMVTAFDMKELEINPDVKYINGLITKPVNKTILLDKIKEVLSGKILYENKRIAGYYAKNNAIDKIAGANILLVEDNILNQQIAIELLHKANLNVDVANNGLEALSAIVEKDYDLIFMDIHMPELDGFEATKRIRGIDRYADIPIIAMTANAMQGDKEKSISAGMDDHISKPIDPKILYAALLKWIKPQKRKVNITEIYKNEANTKNILPNLKTINIQKGLDNMGSNIVLFKKILIEFHDNYFNVDEQTKAKIESKQYEEARYLVHTIKGLSGNIAANGLYNAADDLEQALKNRIPTQITSAQRIFKKSLKETMQELHNNMHIISKIEVESKKIGIANREALVEKIEMLLTESNSEVLDLIDDLKMAFDAPEFEDIIDLITKEIDDLDFDDALMSIVELKRMAGL